MSDNQASISSAEFPCCTILIWFGVDQTNVFMICTNFPEDHQLGSWSQVTEFHPSSYQILPGHAIRRLFQ